MLRELVSNNIFVFTSGLYAQVTAGVIMTPEGAIIVDTMPFPSETKQIIQFVCERHKLPVRYVINTHYHADHTYGTSYFEGARVVAHRACRDLIDTRGRISLDRARRSSREMADIKLRLPDIVFDDGIFSIKLGGVTVEMWHTPGHSPDSIVAFAKDEKILFAADTVMPIPFFGDGSWTDFVNSLESLKERSYETIVQGHGEVVLRGESHEKIDEDLAYLHTLHSKVNDVVQKGGSVEQALEYAEIEECGKSRIILNGIAQELHNGNVRALYEQLQNEMELA